MHDLFGAQAVAAVDQRYFAGEIGQEQRLFHGGIAATDDDNFLAAIKEAVAGGAGRYAKALELFFGRKAKPFRLRAGGQNDRVGCVDGAAVGLRDERALRQIKAGDDIGDNLGPHGFGMRFHPQHQVGTKDMGVAGPVFDFGRDGQLAAGLDALHKDRVQHGAGGIDGSAVACGARAYDQKSGMSRLAHRGPRLLWDGYRQWWNGGQVSGCMAGLR